MLKFFLKVVLVQFTLIMCFAARYREKFTNTSILGV